MPTRRSLILIIFLFAISNTAYAQPRSELAAVQSCVRPWLAGVDTVIAATASHPRNRELQTYRRILANSSYAEPYFDPQGRPGLRFLSEVPNEREPWVVIMPFCRQDRLRADYAETGFIASYSDTYKTLMIDTVTELPPVIRGLYLIHEMRHFAQSQSEPLRDDNPQTHLRHEVDAFEVEFSVLDALRLPGYDRWLRTEVARMRDDINNARSTTLLATDSQFDIMLPELSQDKRARDLVASLFFIRALFKSYDEQFSPQESLSHKLGLMNQLYPQRT